MVSGRAGAPGAARLAILRFVQREAVPAATALDDVRAHVERRLRGFLAERRASLAQLDPGAATLVGELERLVEAGGKRIRPVFCVWGYRAAGGEGGEPILRAAGALELFHLFALVHDDVMDESDTRRGVPSTHRRFAAEAPPGVPSPERFGRSVAVLVGDLAAVLADELLLGSGFPPERLLPALRRYGRMREEVAAGQLLDLRGEAGAGEGRARAVAALKTGAYTVEGPLHIGAILAGGTPELLERLSAYARPLGEAFQLRDDVIDLGPNAAPGVEPRTVNRLISEAVAALEGGRLAPEARAALVSLAELLWLPEG